MRVFDFTDAIVRVPGKSVVDGIRKGPQAPCYDGVLAEHGAYVAALRDAGLRLHVLPALEAYPDSVFVEDPAIVLPEGAVLLRPGVASRMGEAEEMRPVLHAHFDRVLALEGDQFADGGDVLVTREEIVIGLSKRTNRAGAEALVGHLKVLGRKARLVETPADVLHFKTASAVLDEDTVMATRALALGGVFDGFKVLTVPDGEEGAANFLRIKDRVFVGDRFPRTIQMLTAAGYDVRPLPVTEIGKIDAGLSCMSLRW